MSDFVSLHRISVLDRIGFLKRVWGLEHSEPLGFDELYDIWIRAEYFNELKIKGLLKISYDNNMGGVFVFNTFDTSGKYKNRHQALALSCFMASMYKNSSAVVESPHESGGIFKVFFEYINDTEYKCTTINGIEVIFKFDASQPSQF